MRKLRIPHDIGPSSSFMMDGYWSLDPHTLQCHVHLLRDAKGSPGRGQIRIATGHGPMNLPRYAGSGRPDHTLRSK
jgi:hypothetical protein